MDKKALLRVVVIACALTSFGVVAAWAGGPVCPPVKCAPPMCPPPMCGPAPVCGPPPTCGPPPCAPMCKENPLAKIFKGAWNVVTGTVALPFALLDCLVEKCRPACGPPPCAPRMACAPPMCPPPMCPPPMCPPQMCGPAGCPPGMMGYGMAPGRPMGFGYGAPRKYVPFAKKKGSPVKYFAGQEETVFGTCW